jgi:hypothetical protein
MQPGVIKCVLPIGAKSLQNTVTGETIARQLTMLIWPRKEAWIGKCDLGFSMVRKFLKLCIAQQNRMIIHEEI